MRYNAGEHTKLQKSQKKIKMKFLVLLFILEITGKNVGELSSVVPTKSSNAQVEAEDSNFHDRSVSVRSASIAPTTHSLAHSSQGTRKTTKKTTTKKTTTTKTTTRRTTSGSNTNSLALMMMWLVVEGILNN